MSNERIAEKIYRMILKGKTEGIRPGQFVEIAIPGLFLRRPISVSDIHGDELAIIYKVVGQGTDRMAAMSAGEELDILTGLGNGYDLSLCGNEALLIGGGVGVPPLIYAAKKLREMGKNVRVVMGFNTKDEVFGEEAFRVLGCETTVCTMDGSYGKNTVAAVARFQAAYDIAREANEKPGEVASRDMLITLYATETKPQIGTAASIDGGASNFK